MLLDSILASRLCVSFCGLGKRLVELSCCQTVLLAHIAHATSSGRHKMDPPNWFPPFPGTYFTAKYGLPLKNLDHLPQMKKVDPERISLAKFRPVAYQGGLLRFLEATQACMFSSTQCTVPSFPAELHTAFVSVYIAQFLSTLRKTN